MTQAQKDAEAKYLMSVVLLDTLLQDRLINEEEYDRCRVAVARKTNAPYGMLEAEDMLWKRGV